MFPQLSEQSLESLSTVQLLPLGTKFFADQGRKGYRYAAFPASTATTSGMLLTAAAAPANSTGLALPTSNTTAQLSAGSTQLLVTNSSTAVTLDEFKDGQLEVLGTNGIGQAYRIAGNSAAAATTGTVTVELAEPLRNTTALANGTNTVNLRVSPYFQPVASSTTALPVGVTVRPIASNAAVQYGWLQTNGQAYVAAASSGTKGKLATQDLSSAGSVADSAAYTASVVGTFIEATASSLASVNLNIA